MVQPPSLRRRFAAPPLPQGVEEGRAKPLMPAFPLPVSGGGAGSPEGRDGAGSTFYMRSRRGEGQENLSSLRGLRPLRSSQKLTRRSAPKSPACVRHQFDDLRRGRGERRRWRCRRCRPSPCAAPRPCRHQFALGDELVGEQVDRIALQPLVELAGRAVPKGPGTGWHPLHHHEHHRHHRLRGCLEPAFSPNGSEPWIVAQLAQADYSAAALPLPGVN